MSIDYHVHTSCLRYIVPFRFEEPFEAAFRKVENQRFVKDEKEKSIWKRKVSTEKGQESDLYHYIRNEFRFIDSNSGLSEKKQGCEWIHWRSKDASGKEIFGADVKTMELLYYPAGIKNKRDGEWIVGNSWKITISNIGLMLFRNGLGFLWYELTIPKKNIDSAQLKAFQNEIRELNLNKASKLWESQKTVNSKAYGLVIDEHNGYKTYITPFSLGNWMNEMLAFLPIEYLASRKTAYANMVKNSFKGLKDLKKEIIFDESQAVNKYSRTPDKAILFSYIAFDHKPENETQKDKYTLVYHITNGYKDSYHFSEDVIKDIKRPFENVYWYATQEGASYLVWPDSDNKEVFTSLIPGKVRVDYFTLYLKVLYQSFSLLLYAEKIQNEITVGGDQYLVDPLNQNISLLFEEINVFLTKSMAASVSHIHHQSEFYIYIKERLRIQDDVESVTAGLNALDMLQREQRQREDSRRMQEEWKAEQKRDHDEKLARIAVEEREKKRDEKLQAIMGLFALLGIGSALVDWFDFIAKFDPNGDLWQLSSKIVTMEVIVIAIVAIVSIIALVFTILAVCNVFKREEDINSTDNDNIGE